MKTKISIVLAVVLLLTSASVFATEAIPVLINIDETPVPTLYDSSLPFKLVQDGDKFTIILDENASTGYLWGYEISKEDHVQFIEDEIVVAENPMPGAPSEHSWTFEVKSDGVSTILFTYARSWEADAAKTIDVLVYKNGEKVFVEENQIITINSPVSSNDFKVIVDGEKMVETDAIKNEDGVFLVPLRAIAESLGYKVSWNAETLSIEIQKGAIWTSIQVDKNAYFKNRMAPWELSVAPVLMDSTTYVPVEFFTEILGADTSVENKVITIGQGESTIHQGYVVDVQYKDNGEMTLTLGSEKGTTDFTKQVIIHTSSDRTISQKSFDIGSYVKVISPMVMTMSLPGQTSGYVIY